MLRRVVLLVHELYSLLLLPHGRDGGNAIDVDIILRLVFFTCYLPIVMFVILLSVNCALDFCFRRVLPAIQQLPLLQMSALQNEHQQQQQFASAAAMSTTTSTVMPDTTTAITAAAAATGISAMPFIEVVLAHCIFWCREIFTAMIPHATEFFILMAACHKVVTCVAEASVDTLSNYQGQDYPLLFASVKISMASWRRQLMTAIIFCGLLWPVASVAWEFLVDVVADRPATVLISLVSNACVCAGFLSLSLLSEMDEEHKAAAEQHQLSVLHSSGATIAADTVLSDNDSFCVSDTEDGAAATTANGQQREQQKQKKKHPPYQNPLQAAVALPGSLLQEMIEDFRFLHARFGLFPAAAAAIHHQQQEQQRRNATGNNNDNTTNDNNSDAAEMTLRSQSQELASFLAATQPYHHQGSAASGSSRVLQLWWRRHVHFLRHLAFAQLVLWVLWWMCRDGAIAAARYSAESLIAFQFPNFVLSLALGVSCSAIRTWSSLLWLFRHKAEWSPVVFVVSLPYVSLCVYTLVLFATTSTSSASTSFYTEVLILWAAMMVISRTILLCREHAVSGALGIRWYTQLRVGAQNNMRKRRRSRTRAKSPDPSMDTMAEAELAAAATADPARHSSTTTSSTTIAPAPRRRLAPGVACILENALELGVPFTTETISLEITADLTDRNAMTLVKRGVVFDLIREVDGISNSSSSSDGENDEEEEGNNNKKTNKLKQPAVGEVRVVPPVFRTASLLLPRLLFFQSSTTFSGQRFQLVRTVLRVVTGVLLCIFIALIIGLVAQESMDVLRPLPVQLHCNSNGNSHSKSNSSGCHDITVDHIVVKLRMELHEATTTASEEQRADDGSDELDHDEAGALCRFEPLPGLHLFELALLQITPYLATAHDIYKYVDFVNSLISKNSSSDNQATNWTIAPFINDDGLPFVGATRTARQNWRGFTRLRTVRRGKNITLLLIRGTDLTDIVDFLEDVAVFHEAFVFQAATNFLPGLSLLPLPIVQDLIRVASEFWLPRLRLPPASCVGSAGNATNSSKSSSTTNETRKPLDEKKICSNDEHRLVNERSFANIVERFLVEQELAKRPLGGDDTNNYKLVIAAHSLGGVVGQAVGARVNASRVVAFSAPGIRLPLRKFHIPGDADAYFRRAASNVVVDFDIVPTIGVQSVGTLLRGTCLDTIQERCHSAESVVESMFRLCGTVRRAFPRLKNVTLF